jgi:hypothetical protein
MANILDRNLTRVGEPQELLRSERRVSIRTHRPRVPRSSTETCLNAVSTAIIDRWFLKEGCHEDAWQKCPT